MIMEGFGIGFLLRLIRDEKSVFISNSSGGKDSQAMYLRLRRIIPEERLIVIHAHLPIVEWEGTLEFLNETVDHELIVCSAKKTFFDMVEKRGMFPSPTTRQCTSDLKRDPISKEIRKICNERGYNRVVNCLGIRSEESSARKKKVVFKPNARENNSKREWFEWLPIHSKNTKYIFETIHKSGQKPFWVYAAGMTRKSCRYCIMASEEDLCTAYSLEEDGLSNTYDLYERKFDRTMIMPTVKGGRKFLIDIIKTRQSETK